eukprot:tig00000093_g3486.t1
MPPPVETMHLRSGHRHFHSLYAGCPTNVYTPEGPGPWPLVLFLADEEPRARGAPADPEARLRREVEAALLEVAAVSPVHAWFRPDPAARLPALLAAFQRDLRHSGKALDPARFYLTGVGAGASAALELAATQPGLFAAAVIVGAASALPGAAAALADTPLWIFQDPQSAADSAPLAAALRAAGARELRVTEVKAGRAEACRAAFASPDLPACTRRRARRGRGRGRGEDAGGGGAGRPAAPAEAEAGARRAMQRRSNTAQEGGLVFVA